MKETIKLKCDACGSVFEIDFVDYELSWEVVDTDDHGENSMGIELHHEAIIEVECPDCGEAREPITVTLSVWEYPEGVYNNQDIEVDGAELLEGCDLQSIAPIGDMA